jgi:vacuolar protein sorting-associated protein 54
MVQEVLRAAMEPASAALSTGGRIPGMDRTMAMHVLTDTNEIPQKVIEAGHMLATNLIRLRSADSRASVGELSQLYTAVVRFAEKDEAFLRVSASWSPMRAAVISQMKGFLDGMHSREVKKVVILLDNENWAQATVAREFQQIIDGIAGPLDDAAGPDTPDTLRVGGGRRFKVVSSLLMFSKTILSYLQVPTHLRPLAAEVATKLAELLQVFHRRIHQLILGAEVTKLLSLRSIPAKFLALTSQTLSALIELVPHLRAALHMHLTQPSEFASLQQLDAVALDLQNHANQLFAKFASLIRERVQAHLGDRESYRVALSFPIDPRLLQESCTAPMSRLCKEITSLHRVLSQYLAADQIRVVFAMVTANLAADIPELCAKIDLSVPAAAPRLLADVQFLVAMISSLTNVDFPPTSLLAWANSKQSQSPPSPPPPPPPSSSPTPASPTHPEQK